MLSAWREEGQKIGLTFLVQLKGRVPVRPKLRRPPLLLHRPQMPRLLRKWPHMPLLPLLLHRIHRRRNILVITRDLFLQRRPLVRSVYHRFVHGGVVLLSALTVLVLGADVGGDVVEEVLPVVGAGEHFLIFELHAELDGARFDFAEGDPEGRWRSVSRII